MVAVVLGVLAPLALAAGGGESGLDHRRQALESLGQALFFDTRLSRNRSQSCASCHDPARGFADPGNNGLAGAVSLGDDGHSLGDRNAPSAAYAAFTPGFHRDSAGRYVGGQFWDGRAPSLEEQAKGPPLNPIEMGLPDMAAVRARLQENPFYVSRFTELFGSQSLASDAVAFEAMASSIAAFERSAVLSPFDSRYDRYLRGEYRMTEQEELGRTLFFSQQFTNCNQCHQLRESALADDETFSNYQYHNIGVPVNTAVRALNGTAPDRVDEGLLNNPLVTDISERGKFRTPSLRNVAVTGPYMHNGVFADLETVVRFYNSYNSKSAASKINPETGQPWGRPEVPANLSLTELEHGPALDTRRIAALVAFLETLTDQRYEALLD
ncbi:cytochrome-c peroxidase [Marinobacterium rhizophilum]|uniref:Methylamine utilization protein MauG n=1 Tax=Marinobacterium rhizophilum TaxID=420402 RepID=A0ABY5HNJ6_9GAMM|nr:cytochrome c peroxidase [Marinobacterium rhizophilum]UTW13143.1 methylamine utilization protein MauG [Marinobacterium rhizophilum]